MATTTTRTMSSTTAPPTSTSTVQLDNEGFYRLWKALHNQAETFLQDEEFSSLVRRQKCKALLETITKLMFGVDESKKSIAAQHGCMELIVKLLKSARVLSEEELTNNNEDGDTSLPVEKIWMSGLKAVKCSVIRNKEGRRKCRSARVFGFVGFILEQSLSRSSDNNNIAALAIVEESMTTLAAVCLADDLNALQASVQLRRYVEQTAQQYPDDDRFASMHQKITYLNALFDAIEKEQKELLECDDFDEFFDTVVAAERVVQSDNNNDDEDALSKALSSIQEYAKHTRLLNPLLCDLYTKRASIHLQQQDYQGALDDCDCALSSATTSISEQTTTIQIHKIRADAHQGLGQHDQAKAALSKAKLIQPDDAEIQAKLDALALNAKNKQQANESNDDGEKS